MTKQRAINLCCAALMILLMILQFTPFWHYGDPQTSTSIQGYVWFPSENSKLDGYIQAETGNADFSINNVLTMPILELILCAIGIVLCIAKSESSLIGLLPAAAGLVGTFGYLTNPAFHLDSGWVLHMLLCLIMLILSAYGLISELPRQARAS